MLPTATARAADRARAVEASILCFLSTEGLLCSLPPSGGTEGERCPGCKLQGKIQVFSTHVFSLLFQHSIALSTIA